MAGKPIEAVLTQAQRDTLELDAFIFHIIDPEAPGKIVKLDEVQLQDKQKAFFLERLKDASEGTQYIFDEDVVNLKEDSLSLIGGEGDFVDLSFEFTKKFAQLHGGHMSPGVFIVSVVKYLAKAHDWRNLVFLVKMDQQESFSYRYQEKDGRRVAVVDEVPNALNENKRAIQKSALIDAADIFVWDVLAFDRVQKPLLGDYFKSFLGVKERQQDSTLTRSAYTAVREWAKGVPKDQLPPGDDVNTLRGRALNYLKDHDTFSTDAFVDAVVRDEDPDRKAENVNSLNDALAVAGVAGQQFRPQPDSLPKSQRKQVYETSEGVTITYEGTEEAVGMNIERLANGGSIITIETHQLIPKG